MCSAQISTSDRTAGLNAAPPWRVVAVAAMPAYRLNVCFSDGTSGIVNMSALATCGAAGIFASLHEPSVFEAVHVELGAVAWPGDVDLAPDALYVAIKKQGSCTLSAEGFVQ